MISVSRDYSRKPVAPAPHERLLLLLPSIRRYAAHAFRDQPRDIRRELIAEVVANAFVAFARLAEAGKTDRAYATPMAMFACKQVRAGHRVGATLNVNDVMSPHCQQRKGVQVKRLDLVDKEEETWRQVVVEGRTATSADLVASRIDFPHWLASLSPRNRKIAEALSSSE